MRFTEPLYISKYSLVLLQLLKCGSSVTRWIASTLNGTPVMPTVEATDAYHHPVMQGVEWVAARRRKPGGFLRVYAIVRDPVERLRSCWADKMQHIGDTFIYKGFRIYDCFRAGMSFEDFALAVADIPDSQADPHFVSQWSSLHHKMVFLPTRLLRLERLAEDWFKASREDGVPSLAIPLINESSRPKPAVSAAIRAVIEQRYAKDYEVLSYAQQCPDPSIRSFVG